MRDSSRLKMLRKIDGRWVTAFLVAGYFGVLAWSASLLSPRSPFELQAFQWFGAMEPGFADLRGIVAGTERFDLGIDPWQSDLHDLWNRPFNYPHWWLYTDHLGLDKNTVPIFGVGMAVLYLVSSFFVLGRLSLLEGFTAGLFLISCNVVFGMVRGNVDLIICAFIALALGLRRFPSLSALTLLLTGILKIYPGIALLAMAAPPWRKTVPWMLAAIALLAGYEWIYRAEFQHIAAANIRTEILTFGSATWGLGLSKYLGKPGFDYQIFLGGAQLLILVMAIAVWIRPRISLPVMWERELYAFRLGACLYLGAFALGACYDYRTMVLIFCLPFLFRLRREERPARTWALATLGLILLYMDWPLLFSQQLLWPFLLKQAVAWGMVTGLTGIFAALLLPPRKNEA